MHFTKKSVLIISAFLPLLAQASNYPSNYGTVIDSEYAQDGGPVKIVRSVHYVGAIELNVYYEGALKDAPNLTALVIVHYQDGDRQLRVPMKRVEFSNYSQATVTNGCLVGMPGGCAQDSSPEMKDLLFWANHGMHLNALNVEVAFDAGNGQWDSRGGANYKFNTFPDTGR